MPIAPAFLRHVGLATLSLLALAHAAAATLEVRPASSCAMLSNAAQDAPPAAGDRIPDSQAVSGSHDIAWVWLGSPTTRYDHDALGSMVHAGTLHVLARQPDGSLLALSFQLPASRVIEDRVPRLADLDGDGRDEIILVESDLKRGSSVVVYGLRRGTASAKPTLVERARSAYLGASHRWLNPAGIADFDGDGHADIAAVTTPHIGGVLTLYRYRPPRLAMGARRSALANHRIGTVEQHLSTVVDRPGRRPALIVPETGLRSLRVLELADGGWKDVAAPVQLTAPVQRMIATANGACVSMTGGANVQVRLRD